MIYVIKDNQIIQIISNQWRLEWSVTHPIIKCIERISERYSNLRWRIYAIGQMVMNNNEQQVTIIYRKKSVFIGSINNSTIFRLHQMMTIEHIFATIELIILDFILIYRNMAC